MRFITCRLPDGVEDPAILSADGRQVWPLSWLGLSYETLSDAIPFLTPQVRAGLSLAIAGWLRYLLGVGDDGKAIEISADPMKDELQAQLAGVEVGRPESYNGQIRPILANANIFGSDLCALGMADRIEEMFVSELAGEGAVRRTLEAYLG